MESCSVESFCHSAGLNLEFATSLDLMPQTVKSSLLHSFTLASQQTAQLSIRRCLSREYCIHCARSLAPNLFVSPLMEKDDPFRIVHSHS